MVRKYFLQQLGLLIMVSVIMVLTNILGYKMPVGDSIAGILVLDVYKRQLYPLLSALPLW